MIFLLWCGRAAHWWETEKLSLRRREGDVLAGIRCPDEREQGDRDVDREECAEKEKEVRVVWAERAGRGGWEAMAMSVAFVRRR